MKLTVNKRFVKTGDVVNIKWDAEEGNSPRLILHNGTNEVTLSVPISGEKQFRMKGKKGLRWIELTTLVGETEKRTRRYLWIYGSVKMTDDFEYMDHQDTPVGRMQENMKRWWNSFTPEKKKMYVLLLLLMLYQFLIHAAPGLAGILLYGTIFWLFWQVIKQ